MFYSVCCVFMDNYFDVLINFLSEPVDIDVNAGPKIIYSHERLKSLQQIADEADSLEQARLKELEISKKKETPSSFNFGILICVVVIPCIIFVLFPDACR